MDNQAAIQTSVGELRTVQIALIDVIRRANTWADITRAADALFHVRAVHDAVYGADKRAAMGGSPLAEIGSKAREATTTK